MRGSVPGSATARRQKRLGKLVRPAAPTPAPTPVPPIRSKAGKTSTQHQYAGRDTNSHNQCPKQCGGQSTADMGADIAADDGANREQRHRRPLQVGRKTKIRAATRLAASTARVLSAFVIRSSMSSPTPARPASSRPSLHQSTRRKRRSRRQRQWSSLTSTCAVPPSRPVPLAKQGRDSGLCADKDTREEDQPGSHSLENPRWQRQQEGGARDRTDHARGDNGGGDPRVLTKFPPVTE